MLHITESRCTMKRMMVCYTSTTSDLFSVYRYWKHFKFVNSHINLKSADIHSKSTSFMSYHDLEYNQIVVRGNAFVWLLKTTKQS